MLRMSESRPMTERAHRFARMTGRNPDASHRAATPLELLFDLTFVVAFSQASGLLAHSLAEDHAVAGILSFFFAMFAICWAWINFTWFASAYDTDDWVYRVTTMVQMIGVIILALGLPDIFHSIEDGDHFDNDVVVAGYVIMRVAMVAQWLRAAKHDPERRRTALAFATWIGVTQIGWVALAIVELPNWVYFVITPIFFGLEMLVPVFAERKTSGTPWHAGHVAERYGLLTIIAIGEVIFGTITTVAALVEHESWSTDAALIAVAGVGLAFGLWWNYFIMPSSEFLTRFRSRSFGWGYGHMVIFASIAATGAGLHVVAYLVEHETKISTLGAILTVAVPVAIFSVALIALYSYLVGEFDVFHVALVAGVLALLALASVLAANGASLGLCLIIVTLAPAVVVVGYETVGHRNQSALVTRVLVDRSTRG